MEIKTIVVATENFELSGIVEKTQTLKRYILNE